MGGDSTRDIHRTRRQFGGHPVEFKDGSNLDVRTLLPALTTDVLIHTWDLARAVGLDVVLDEDLCEVALAGAQAKEAALREIWDVRGLRDRACSCRRSVPLAGISRA